MKSVFCTLTALFLLTGCSMFEVDNNYLRPEDFARKLIKDGIHVDNIRPLNPAPVAASAAMELKIGNSSIGVYKFDTNIPAQKKRLERIRKGKKVFFNGIPFPVYEVSGSFIVIGLDKHKEKARILESLMNFK